MKFYHYTSTDKPGLIIRNQLKNAREMFRPRRRFIRLSAAPADLPSKVYEPALFGLLDPLDIKWCTVPYLDRRANLGNCFRRRPR